MPMLLIQSQTLGSSAASVTFSNIPQTFKTLRLVMSTRDERAAIYGNLRVNVNGSSASYSGKLLQGDGSSAISSTTTTTELEGLSVGASATANTFSNVEYLFPNYASTSAYKVVSIDNATETNATTIFWRAVAMLWSNSAAITQIAISANSASNFVAGSSFYLYGLS